MILGTIFSLKIGFSAEMVAIILSRRIHAVKFNAHNYANTHFCWRAVWIYSITNWLFAPGLNVFMKQWELTSALIHHVMKRQKYLTIHRVQQLVLSFYHTAYARLNCALKILSPRFPCIVTLKCIICIGTYNCAYCEYYSKMRNVTVKYQKYKIIPFTKFIRYFKK